MYLIINFYIQILLFLKQLLIKFTDPDIQTKQSRYPDPDSALTDPIFYYPDPDSALTDPTFYYPDPDSASSDFRIFGSDLDRISDRIWISDKSLMPTLYNCEDRISENKSQYRT